MYPLFIIVSILVGAGLFALGAAGGPAPATLGGGVVLTLAILGGLRGRASRGLMIALPTVAVLTAGISLAVGPEEKGPATARRQTPAPATGTPAVAGAPAPATPAPGGQDPAALGRQLAASKGCQTCHSVDGSRLVGPTWKGLFGKSETLQDGSRVTVDEAYIRESVRSPNAKVVQGFQPVMPQLPVSDEELGAIIAYIKSLQ